MIEVIFKIKRNILNFNALSLLGVFLFVGRKEMSERNEKIGGLAIVIAASLWD